MKLIRFIPLLLFLCSNPFFSQSNDDSWKVYDDSEVAVINITMDVNDLRYMYDFPSSNEMHPAQVHFKNAFIDEVIDSVGIRIRGNTSRVNDKKSFKLSFNTYKTGGKFYSLEKLNLNGEHNDPSIARSKISWDQFNAIKAISSRAAHAAVFINENYYGLYISVEHIDETFIKKNFEDDSGNLWKCLNKNIGRADLNYIDGNQNSYKIGSQDRVYDLKTNTDLDDYSKLVEFIDFLNNSDDETFRKKLSQKVNLLGLLQVFGMNVLTGMWDDYWGNANNYYLYHEPTRDMFHIIPYDYDNTFGIDWFTVDWASIDAYTFGKITWGQRPLIERVLQFPEFHNLYTHLLSFYKNKKNISPLYGYEIYLLKNKMDPWAEDDNYRTLDYGFSVNDYNNSFAKEGYFNKHVTYSISEFIDKRFASFESQLYYLESDPIIYDFEIYPKNVQPEDSVIINCSVFSKNGINKIQVELSEYGTNLKSNYDMSFSPDNNSMDVRKQDYWEVKLSNFGIGFSGEVRFIVEDSSGTIITYPEEGIEIRSPAEVTGEVLLSELMSSNTSAILDNAGEYDDWLEIYNHQDTIVTLSGKYLTDKKDNLKKWKFPGNVIIGAKKHILIWCDEDQEQAGPHINFKLNANGEFVAIVDNDGITIVDSVTIPSLDDDQSYARQNDDGEWYKTDTSTPGESNIITDVILDQAIPNAYSLKAYPNPFNPSTIIEYEIAKSMEIEIKIYDTLGREIWKVEKEKKEMGLYTIPWNGTSYLENDLATGIYFARIIGENFSESIKLMLLR